MVNPPTLYLEKIADQWMQARGEAQPAVKYLLGALPAGYTTWQRARLSALQHIDKYLYGYSQGRKFDSPNRFYPHFQHLMDNAGDACGCPCTMCAGSAGILPKSSPASSRMQSASTVSSRPSTTKASTPTTSQGQLPPNRISTVQTQLQPKGKAKTGGAGLDIRRVDEEGTPEVYRYLIDKLRLHGTVDEVIKEPLSSDWRNEQQILPGQRQWLKANGQWVPRTEDIVLYIRELPECVDFV